MLLSEKRIRSMIKNTIAEELDLKKRRNVHSLNENAKIIEFQKIIGLPEETADGDWGPTGGKTDKAWHAFLKAKHASRISAKFREMNLDIEEVGKDWKSYAVKAGYEKSLSGILQFAKDLRDDEVTSDTKSKATIKARKERALKTISTSIDGPSYGGESELANFDLIKNHRVVRETTKAEENYERKGYEQKVMLAVSLQPDFSSKDEELFMRIWYTASQALDAGTAIGLMSNLYIDVPKISQYKWNTTIYTGKAGYRPGDRDILQVEKISKFDGPILKLGNNIITGKGLAWLAVNLYKKNAAIKSAFASVAEQKYGDKNPQTE